jgi:hypothetical protein
MPALFARVAADPVIGEAIATSSAALNTTFGKVTSGALVQFESAPDV